MERIAVGPELSFSRIAYGLMGLGGSWEVDERIPETRVRELLDACLAHGITTLDHADIYTAYRGEAVLGQAFRASPGLRDRFEVITKCGIKKGFGEHAGAYGRTVAKHYDTTPEHITSALDRSLREMGTDRVDLLLIHRPDPLMDHERTGRALDAAVASGKARAVGVSNFRPWDVSLLQSAMGEPLVCNQIEMSLAHTDAFTNGDLAFLQEHSLRPMAWSPLGGGTLFDPATPAGMKLAEVAEAKGCRPDQLALAFLLRHPAGIIPVVGTGNVERIAHAAGAVSVKLSRVEWFELLEAARGEAVA